MAFLAFSCCVYECWFGVLKWKWITDNSFNCSTIVTRAIRDNWRDPNIASIMRSWPKMFYAISLLAKLEKNGASTLLYHLHTNTPDIWQSCRWNKDAGVTYTEWGPAAAEMTIRWWWRRAEACHADQNDRRSGRWRCRPVLRSALGESSWSRSWWNNCAGFWWNSTEFLFQWT